MYSPKLGTQSLLLLLLLSSTLVTAPTESSAQTFGGAIATDGDAIFVGHSSQSTEAGTVHVFRKVDGTWQEVQKLMASDQNGADDRFGRALYFADGQLFVGATTRSESTGATYVFDKRGANAWQESAILVPASIKENETFGRSITKANGQLLVGAAGADSSRGKVFTFSRNASGNWVESSQISLENGQSNDLLGLNVVSAGNMALISSFKQGGPDRVPEVYSFRLINGTWVSEGALETGEHNAQSIFGLSVAMTDSRAFVGAQNHDNRGGVFLFTRDKSANKWIYDGILYQSDEEGRTGFGVSVAVQDGRLYVGAPGAADGAGRVYTYDLNVAAGDAPSQVINGPEATTGFGEVLHVSGKYLIAGLPSADFGLGRAVVLTKDASGNWQPETEFSVPIKSLAAVKGEQVKCEDGDAAGFGCEQVDLLSYMPLAELGGGRGARTNDVWGWTDPETEKEYALVGRMDGTSFVDISDPYNPVLVGTLPMTEGSQANSWRDIKVYKDHAYVVADGAGDHGMQVFDLRQLRNVTNAPVTFKETAHYDKIASAHNIVINEGTGFAYAVGSNSGGETCGGGSHMIDIRDPENPKFAGCFAHTGTGRTGTGYTHDAQCVVYSGPDTRFTGREICFGSNETALSIADVTDKDSTVALASAAYPNVGYAHQGWLTEDQRYFLLDDELDEVGGLVDGTRTLIWDVSDLEDPQLIKEYVSDVKASDHNLYIKGNLVYQSNYVSGLRILDISDIMNPVEVGSFDTVPGESNDPGFDGSWSNYPFFKSGVIVVTSGAEGLFLVRKPDVGL